jgi:hypothetical protein
MALDLPDVLQAQGFECIGVEFTALKAFELVTVLPGPCKIKGTIEFGVLVHEASL